jgi:hypothetical protein
MSSARSSAEMGLGWTTPRSGTIRFAIETGGPAICFRTGDSDPRSPKTALFDFDFVEEKSGFLLRPAPE